MEQESQQGAETSSGARNFQQAAEMVKTIILSVSDLIPLFLDKWAAVNDRPATREMEKDISRIKSRLSRLTRREKWVYPLFFVLFVWNIVLTLIIILKLN